MRAREKLERDLVGDTSAREQTRADNVRATAAKLVPVSLGATLMAGMLAFACGLEVLLAVPAFVLILFTAVLIRRERVRRQVDLPLALPEPLSYADTAARAGAARLAQARKEIVDRARMGRRLPRVVQTVDQLERRALNLMARLEYLGSFLSSCSPTQLESEIARLGGHASGRNDAAGQAYERAMMACGERLERVNRLRLEHDLLRATLDHVLGTLEGVPGRLTRLRLLEIEGLSGPASDSLDEVGRLDEELDVLEAACGPLAEGRAQSQPLALEA